MNLSDLLNFGSQASKLTPGRTQFTLRNTVIEHTTFCAAIREIARLHFRGVEAGVSEGLLLVAQTGSGKTTALQHYASIFPREQTVEGTRVQVLLVITPESPTVKALAEAILVTMGDPAAHRGTTQLKTRRIIHFFKTCGVRMLLIDEFQHFFDGHRTSESRRIADWLKNLLNVVNVPVVLAGLPRSIAVINANPQLRRRFSSPYYMRPFGFSSRDEQLEFRGLLKKIHSRIPIPCPALHEANLSRRFFYATNGLIDYIFKIADEAVSRATESAGACITLETFARAFETAVWRDAPKELNPFSESAQLRHLTRPGEPFDIWDDPINYGAAHLRKKTVKNA